VATAQARLVSVNLAHVIDNPSHTYRGHRDTKPPKTGIDKRPADRPVRLHRLGVDGDTICDTRNHGGPDQAVYAYALPDLDWWAEQLGDETARRLGPGAFGENLTLDGIEVTNSVIGERWRIGSAELQVASPRIPCSTFAGFLDVAHWVKRFSEAGRPGAYLRVLVDGTVTAGDPVTVLERPAHGFTLAESFRLWHGERELAAKALTAPQLPAELRARAARWLAARDGA
jgi:MOSC domain-containing protein YiiM